MEDEELWSHQRTAHFLGIKEQTLYGWVSRKTAPPSFKIGGVRRYPATAVRAWLQTKSEPGAGS